MAFIEYSDGEDFKRHIFDSVVPRPIALASTVDEQGIPNLSPFSFFNAFSIKPPILVFSPARRTRNNTRKDTLSNVISTQEVVIAIVNSKMAQQVSLSSAEFAPDIDEFSKSGLRRLPAKEVRPFLVADSPVNFECKVRDSIPLGDEGGSGNLVICEVVRMHVRSEVMVNGRIDALRLDAISRFGGNWYGRIQKTALFEIEKPLNKKVIGVDALPAPWRNSKVLTGHHLALLANTAEMPAKETGFFNLHPEWLEVVSSGADSTHRLVARLLDHGDTDAAWQILLQSL